MFGHAFAQLQLEQAQARGGRHRRHALEDLDAAAVLGLQLIDLVRVVGLRVATSTSG
jgi:hypothetical protein